MGIMKNPEILQPPVRAMGKYHIIDSGDVIIGSLNHKEIRDYVIELINAHIPNEDTMEAVRELEDGKGEPL